MDEQFVLGLLGFTRLGRAVLDTGKTGWWRMGESAELVQDMPIFAAFLRRFPTATYTVTGTP